MDIEAEIKEIKHALGSLNMYITMYDCPIPVRISVKRASNVINRSLDRIKDHVEEENLAQIKKDAERLARFVR